MTSRIAESCSSPLARLSGYARLSVVLSELFAVLSWVCEIKFELEQKATLYHYSTYVRQRRSYGRLSTGIGKSVCYDALRFVHDFRGMTASDFYPCLEAAVKSLAIVILL